VIADRCDGMGLHTIDARRRWRGARDLADEALDGGVRPLYFNPHAFAIVLHESGQTEPVGESIHRGAKTDALNHTPHADRSPFVLHGPRACIA